LQQYEQPPALKQPESGQTNPQTKLMVEVFP